MKKFLKVLAVSTLAATTLVGCGKKDAGTGSTGGDTAAQYAKVGLGVVSTYNDGQVNSTIAAIGLDKDGKINYIDIDVAQSTPGGEGELDKTKKERGADYAMKKASAIGKEWYEQAAAFEEWCKGKTPDEVANMKTKDYHGGKAPAEADLAAGCTIVVDDMLAAVAKANTNAAEVSAAKVGIGEIMSNDAEKKQLNTTIALVATEKKKKIVFNDLDVAQVYDGVTDTKTELKERYNMKGASAIGKEWYEQAAAFETWANTKTLDEVANVKTKDYHGGKAPADSDLSSGCTIVIDDILAAYAEAGSSLK